MTDILKGVDSEDLKHLNEAKEALNWEVTFRLLPKI